MSFLAKWVFHSNTEKYSDFSCLLRVIPKQFLVQKHQQTAASMT